MKILKLKEEIKKLGLQLSEFKMKENPQLMINSMFFKYLIFVIIGNNN